MSVTLGAGDYRYRVEEGWGRLPDGWSFHEVAAVGDPAPALFYAVPVFARSQYDRHGVSSVC